MATVVLSVIGNVVGTAIGGPIGGAIGQAIGAVAGSAIDAKLFPAPTQEGPRLTDLKVTSSTEGAPVARLYGKMRLPTQLIWATKFKESVTTSGGKSMGSKPKTRSYSYSCSFAIGLCEGEISGIGNVWADNKLLDITQYNYRLYKGTETQDADPKIEAIEGSGNAPAYRGLAYIVFEDLPLEKFGNRLPVISVEVMRQPPSEGERIETKLKAVTMIPAMGEVAYATSTIWRLTGGAGASQQENRHTASGKTDFPTALDQLETTLPNCDSVSLVIAWHGTDLRAGVCEIKPKVEFASKETIPYVWQVSGLTRAGASVISSDGDGPLLGGAPSDRSVYEAIIELKDRGKRIVFYPFIMMDVAAGNSLPNPYSNSAATVGQPAYPWRGRITCSPAPGYTGSPDKTAAAATQVDALFGAAAPGDFGAWDGATIPYSGPAEWSIRRMILHYAKLCAAAGGVDAFLIGSEMRELNRIRSAATTYPAVAQWIALADDVRSILPSADISYAADWSEYFGHHLTDGSNDVLFHLDPLWSDANIDFVGIDNYMPLSDWRRGLAHLDADAGVRSIYDRDYLMGNVEGGEGYDWYYASQADRDDQVRTPIVDTDPAAEDWVFRYKDIRAWWLNDHHDRPGGVRSGTPTAWVPESKPIWFTEFGCGTVDRGTNQPNVFIDPKSSESFLPYYSTGQRDDAMQRAYLEAVLNYWDPAEGNNPISAVYGDRMIDTTSMFAWTWDARPFPAFPYATNVWRDGENWRLGHWINGRADVAPLADVVADLAGGLGVEVDAAELHGSVRGYLIDRVMTARAAIEPLMSLYFFDAVTSGETLAFRHRGAAPVLSFDAEDLVALDRERGDYELIRGQETELPRTATLHFYDPAKEFQAANVESRRLKGSTSRIVQVSAPIVLDFSEAQGICDALLIDQHVMRERATLALPPSALAIEPADVVTLDLNGRSQEMRLDALGWGNGRQARLTRTDPETYIVVDGPVVARPPPPLAEPGPIAFQMLDLPMLADDDVAGVPWLAAAAKPWARAAVYRSPSTSGYVLDQVLENRAIVGALAADLPAGPMHRWDRSSVLAVTIPPDQALASAAEIAVLGGANVGAILAANGEWEIVQWVTATLTGPGEYDLTQLLRGQFGSELGMSDPALSGATFVVLDEAVLQATIAATQRGNALNWKYGPSTKPIDDPTYATEALTFRGVGLRPLSPCQLRLRSSGSDLVLTWIRRTRIGGDAWGTDDVPLGEEQERYEVDIYDGLDVVRTIAVTSPTATYTAAQQAADFGGAQTSLTVAVYQVSVAWGRGVGRSESLNA